MSTPKREVSARTKKAYAFLKKNDGAKGHVSSLKSQEMTHGLIDIGTEDYIQVIRKMDKSGGTNSEGKKGVIWDGSGDAAAWIIASGNIKRRFEAEGVWDWVDPTVGQEVATGTPARAPDDPPIEKRPTYGDPPVLDLEAKRTDRITEIDAAFTRQEELMNASMPADNPAFNVMRVGKADAIAMRRLEHMDQISTVLEPAWRRDHLALMVNYEKNVERWREENSKVFKIFVNSFGTSAQSVISTHLNARNYRRCWRELNRAYGAMRAGEDSSTIMTMINNAVWDGTKYSINDFMEFMESLIDQATAGGNTFTIRLGSRM